jgi:hypothetical protein
MKLGGKLDGSKAGIDDNCVVLLFGAYDIGDMETRALRDIPAVTAALDCFLLGVVAACHVDDGLQLDV